MRMAFLAKYADFGLLLLRVSIGVLFIVYTGPVLMGGPNGWAHFGAGVKNLGIHSHFQIWGFIGALLGCIGAVLVIFGLFFGLAFSSCSFSRSRMPLASNTGAVSGRRCLPSKCASF